MRKIHDEFSNLPKWKAYDKRHPERRSFQMLRWQKNNKGKQDIINKRFRKRRVEFIQSYKEQPCKDCGSQYEHYIMELDHLIPRNGIPMNRFAGMERLLEELSTCDVVCANCHRRRTWERRQQNGARRSKGGK